MARLSELFTHIQKDVKYYLRSNKGSDFEDRINTRLHNIGYSRIEGDDVENFKDIKLAIQAKDRDDNVENTTTYKQHFIVQPSGSQNYPDFMVFDKSYIYGIEVKYSTGKQLKPMWNSGLPRQNGIYIFGCFGVSDITFFIGRDVVSAEEAEEMHKFFGKVKEHQEQFNETKMQEQKYGFAVYVRKAFEQKKTNPKAIIDYFGNPNRAALEKKVIDYV